MQYLKKSKLSGYKSIQNLDISFGPGLNIVIGKNGSGKTNFFRFLNNALNFTFENYSEFKSELTLFNSYETIISAGRKLDIQSEISNIKNNNIVKSDVIYKIESNGVVDYKAESESEIQIVQNPKIKYQSNFIQHGIPDFLPIIDKAYSFEIKESNKGDSIEFNFVTDSKKPYFLRSILADFIFFTIHTKEFDEQNIEKSIMEKINNNLSIIRNAIIRFTPIQDIRLSESLKVFKEDIKKSIVVSNICFEYKVNDSWINFSDLSDGTKRMFLIVSDLAIGYTYNFKKFNISTNGLENTRIVLIEEPELGIHPHQLHLISTFLKDVSESIQIIISTHSPQFLDILSKTELNKIIICELDENNNTSLRHMNDDEINSANSYLLDNFYFSDFWRFSNFNR